MIDAGIMCKKILFATAQHVAFFYGFERNYEILSNFRNGVMISDTIVKAVNA